MKKSELYDLAARIKAAGSPSAMETLAAEIETMAATLPDEAKPKAAKAKARKKK